jgi:hypothetical protein
MFLFDEKVTGREFRSWQEGRARRFYAKGHIVPSEELDSPRPTLCADGVLKRHSGWNCEEGQDSATDSEDG